MTEVGSRTIPCSELPEARPGDVLSQEWDTYRREVARLLAEGHEGKFVLIKGGQVIAVHDTWDAAREAGLRLYLLEPFLVRQVCAQEPLLRLRGYSLPCPS
ncbi:MAG TPA: hypothetical protein VKD72_22215 [Gemmataceae bacterium]|nr:hypothetical protein [Gemmataceae bacterium]